MRVALVAGLNPTSHERADDSHAPPVYTFQTALSSFKEIRIMSNPGKVLRVESN